MSNKEAEKSPIAFTDFKSSVTVLEFESVMALADEEYAKLNRVAESKIKFEKKAEESMNQIKSQQANMPPGLLEKLLEGLERKANKEVFTQFNKEIKRHVAVTDFLNRFRGTDDQLEYLDFKPKNKKQDGNI